jgi:hypothetical protein
MSCSICGKREGSCGCSPRKQKLDRSQGASSTGQAQQALRQTSSAQANGSANPRPGSPSGLLSRPLQQQGTQQASVHTRGASPDGQSGPSTRSATQQAATRTQGAPQTRQSAPGDRKTTSPTAHPIQAGSKPGQSGPRTKVEEINYYLEADVKIAPKNAADAKQDLKSFVVHLAERYNSRVSPQHYSIQKELEPESFNPYSDGWFFASDNNVSPTPSSPSKLPSMP